MLRPGCRHIARGSVSVAGIALHSQSDSALGKTGVEACYASGSVLPLPGAFCTGGSLSAGGSENVLAL